MEGTRIGSGGATSRRARRPHANPQSFPMFPFTASSQSARLRSSPGDLCQRALPAMRSGLVSQSLHNALVIRKVRGLLRAHITARFPPHRRTSAGSATQSFVVRRRAEAARLRWSGDFPSVTAEEMEGSARLAQDVHGRAHCVQQPAFHWYPAFPQHLCHVMQQ